MNRKFPVHNIPQEDLSLRSKARMGATLIVVTLLLSLIAISPSTPQSTNVAAVSTTATE